MKGILNGEEKEEFFDSIPHKLRVDLADIMFKGMIK
jgi:hypothetical protein